MKKLSIYFFILLTKLGFGTPINNPSLPVYIQEGLFLSKCNPVSLRVGYEGNFISDARLQQQGVNSNRVDNFRLNGNSGSLIFNIKNRFDVFAIIGGSRIKSNWRISPPFGGLFRIEMETRYHFSWFAGGRAVLWHNEKTAVGITGRYFATNPDISWLTNNGLPQVVRGGEICYEEWQVDFGLSHKIGIFVPYFGIKYSDARSEITGLPVNIIISSEGTNILKMKRKDHVGGFIGVTLTCGKSFLLNLEARLADEEAATVSGQFRF